MDRTDKKILNILQQNARVTNKELAKEMGLSTTPVFERVKKLEKQGYIQNYVALVDNKKVDRNLIAYLSVKLDKHSKGHLLNFKNSVSRLNEVMECYQIAGNADYVIKIALRDMDEYARFITEKISAIENINSIDVSFVLDEVKRQTAYVIN